MNDRIRFAPGLALAALLLLGPLAGVASAGPSKEDVEKRMLSSIEVLKEILGIPEGGVPKSLLGKASGIIVIPHMVKGGFIVAANRGHGIIVHRLADGRWSDPCFCTITGGSIGFQIGGQATDLLLVVNNERGFQALMGNNFKLGGQASVAAGPAGREASAATDAALKADIYSYSRSKGLFGGISLEGAGITVDDDANTTYYGKLLDGKTLVGRQSKPYPASAQPLLDVLKPYAGKKK
jgi:lipid-binding SYLF domain-containing protein